MIIEHKINPYPRRIWVVIKENFDKIKSEFNFKYESDYELTNKKIVNNYDAIVITVSKNNKAGFMVFITDDISNSTLVHESLHVALNIYIDCEMVINSEMDQEPLCYLTEYIYSLLETDIKENKQ